MEDLRQELERKTAQLAALREIGRAINAAWDLRATLTLITRKTAEVMGMDSCSIYLLDEAGEYLVLEATTGLAQESVGQAEQMSTPGVETFGLAIVVKQEGPRGPLEAASRSVSWAWDEKTVA